MPLYTTLYCTERAERMLLTLSRLELKGSWYRILAVYVDVFIDLDHVCLQSSVRQRWQLQTLFEAFPFLSLSSKLLRSIWRFFKIRRQYLGSILEMGRTNEILKRQKKIDLIQRESIYKQPFTLPVHTLYIHYILWKITLKQIRNLASSLLM